MTVRAGREFLAIPGPTTVPAVKHVYVIHDDATFSKIAMGRCFPVAFGPPIPNVSDPSGGAVSGAKLTLTHADTNVQLTGETDSLGNSVLPQLKPGRYTLEVVGLGLPQGERD